MNSFPYRASRVAAYIGEYLFKADNIDTSIFIVDCVR